MISPRSDYNPNFPATMTPEQIDDYRAKAFVQTRAIFQELKLKRIARRNQKRRERLAVVREQRQKFNEKVTDYVTSI